MPFHIDYSGPAPISTYLRVKAAKETVGAPEPATNDNFDASASQDSIGSTNETQATIATQEENGESSLHKDDVDAKMAVDSPDVPVASSSSSSSMTRVTEETTRFISSFRGRTIQGLKVSLPEGYMGFVLRADDASHSSKTRDDLRTSRTKRVETSKKTTSGRRTRRGAAAKHEIVDVDSDDGGFLDDQAMDIGSHEDEEEKRTISIASQFSDFVLWHPDHPVNETGDEYIRSLNEWTQLAHLVRGAYLIEYWWILNKFHRFMKRNERPILSYLLRVLVHSWPNLSRLSDMNISHGIPLIHNLG
ncbi:hypothetical protein H0H93_004809 [Arthromyces matolae]|nr:hypothetical protein H0H93_004809 [Arthromyces matolae]